MSNFITGVHPQESKYTSQIKIEEMPLPKKVVLPLLQHTGAPSKPIVKIGDSVKTGQLIAESAGFISANLHSSISGKISAIENRIHPNRSNFESIIIDSDDKDESINFISHDPEKLSPSELVEIIKNAGIVGLGGAAFPTHVKLSPPSTESKKKIDTVILNGCECEPYLTCDHRVMVEETKKIVGGLKLIMKILDVQNSFIAIEDNKKDAIEKFNNVITSSDEIETKWFQTNKIKVIKLKTKYPQGAEKQLIKATLKREVPSGKLPMDVGCVVQNVQTAKAIYEAVYEGKPLYERIITVAGGVKRPCNLKVRVGTSLSEIIDYCGGFAGEVKKVIAGGPMMGITQFTLDVPVVKDFSGIVALTEIKDYEPSNCIRCGKCVDTCPMGLVPTIISRLVEKEKYDELKNYNLLDCMECGCCAFECPAKIHLVQNIKLAKIVMKTDKVKS
ncbi:MAG: electron transport complex subunit RsxC [Elusimicrobiota bacterium]